MKKILIFLAFLHGFSVPVYASAIWFDVDDRTLSRNAASADHYRPLRAESQQLKSLLWRAPKPGAGMQGVLLDLPLPDGRSVDVEVFASSLLSTELARRFPEIKTFSIRGIDNPAITGRLDFTPNGFHAMLRTADGIIYINPESGYSPAVDTSLYRSFNKRAQLPAEPFICNTPDHQHRAGDYGYSHETAARTSSERTFGSFLRTYRLALSATREYSLAVAGGNLINTYAEMVTAINRVNEVYERDLAITLLLVSGTELISTSNSDFNDSNAEQLMGKNQLWIDAKIGSANYDIGHIFSTGGGGLASIAAACDTEGFKAQGVTGSSNPTTDAFYIDYVAHELGHQFGATHTFNAGGNNSGACNSANRQDHTFEYATGLFTTYLAASAYEPGSGSTIMSYAGICEAQNLQANSDDYFHARSIEQIREFVDGDIGPTIPWADGSRCGVNAATADMAPTALAGNNYTVPGKTPFVLTGDATDADSDASTFIYTWEQYDLGQATTSLFAMHTDPGSGPLVRSREGSNNPQRFVPALDAILSGNLAANTGERLPTTDRSMNFRLTVRSGTNGVAQDDMNITVDKDAGPFTVNAPAGNSTYSGLHPVNVSWNVANTTAAPVNCALVDILFSTDGGYSFPDLLLDDTNNDGNAEVVLPNISTSQGRIKVSCSNNIFFNVSPGNFAVTASTHLVSIAGPVASNEGNAGSTTVNFSVTLSQPSLLGVTVSFAVTGSGSNPAGSEDFGGTLPSGSITFLPAQTGKTLSIPVSGDLFTEADETFTVTLSNAQNAAIIAGSATGIILNDDVAPTINIAATNANRNEGNSGSSAFTFTVARLGSTSGTSSVSYIVAGSGSHPATADDFTNGSFASGIVSFAAGETSKPVTINVAGDTGHEDDEFFSITLDNALGGTIHEGTAEGTILNDDTVTYYRKKSGGGSNSPALGLLLLCMLAYRQQRRSRPITTASC